ncbi:MAG: TetR/AcrR family transcriptional regulator [Lachnospiraceae bacterium]|nr:TetR/AcrR family transcriptional regulator [Lachnospiraceae bacterium]
MAKHSTRNTRSRIVQAAWELFYENGYDATTVDEIVERSQTSKGSFYHYFAGKDALLSSLSTLFDEKYEELSENLPADMSSFDQLIHLNRELFFMIENSISLDLLARLLSTQLVTSSEKHLMDQNRYYFRLLRRICTDGQKKGELRSDIPVNEMVRTYALQERALMYDWCICGGNYSLSQYASAQLPQLLGYLKENTSRKAGNAE